MATRHEGLFKSSTRRRILSPRSCKLPLAHLDGRETNPGHAVRGAAIVLRVEQQDGAQDKKRRRMRPCDDLQGKPTAWCCCDGASFRRDKVMRCCRWVLIDAEACHINQQHSKNMHSMRLQPPKQACSGQIVCTWAPCVTNIASHMMRANPRRLSSTWRRTEIMPIRFSDPRRRRWRARTAALHSLGSVLFRMQRGDSSRAACLRCDTDRMALMKW